MGDSLGKEKTSLNTPLTLLSVSSHLMLMPADQNKKKKLTFILLKA